MKPAEIREALARVGGFANKRLGQHFLIDEAVLSDIVTAGKKVRSDLILEVGPGLGVLTRELMKEPWRVVCIERDARFVEFLTDVRPVSRSVHVIKGDAARLDWMDVVGRGSWSLISNLPYAISLFAIRQALWSARPADHVVVLVQREVGERALSIAPKGKTSLLSLMVALACAGGRILRRVPPGAFHPPPKVDSVVLDLVPMKLAERQFIWGIDPKQIMEAAKHGFAHPRKKLSSNLISNGWAGAEIVSRVFSHMGLSEGVRAEHVSPKQWAELTRLVKE